MKCRITKNTEFEKFIESLVVILIEKQYHDCITRAKPLFAVPLKKQHKTKQKMGKN